MDLRIATTEDLSAIVDIYNEAISDGGCTADIEAVSVNEKQNWFNSINNENYGIYCVTNRDEVIAYFYFSPWRAGRMALVSTVEISFYVAKSSRGKGVGTFVLENGIELAKGKGILSLMAILLDINLKSKSLLERFGFSVAGHLPTIAKFHNGDCGQYIMLKHL